MNITPEQVIAGQAVYTPNGLRIYDFLVLGLSNRFIWQCPTTRLLHHYNQHITANHLDIGVGTGYFLHHCHFPSAKPRIALMDMNENSLNFTAKRIARYQPECYQHNIFEPVSQEIAAFDSIAINYLLHCLPGTIEAKAIIFQHLKKRMNPNAVLFGSTLLHEGLPRSSLAKSLMGVYNKKGIFSNQQDSFDGLKGALEQYFSKVTLETRGCVALFTARI